MRDSRKVSERRTFPWVSLALVAAPLAGFAGAAAAGLSPSAPMPTQLIDAGASYGPRTLGAEPWRLLSAAVVHAGFTHLMLNVVVLALIGAAVEHRAGRAATALLFVSAALVGASAGTALAPYAVIAGASSGAAGLAAALSVIILVHRSEGPRLRRELWLGAGGVLVVLGYIALGIARDDIDHAGHVGGAVTGLALGALVAIWRTAPRRALMAGAALALVAAAVLYVHGRPAPVEPRDATARLFAIEARFSNLVDAGVMDAGAPLADALESDVAAPLDALSRDASLDDPRQPPRLRARIDRLRRYAAARAAVVRRLAAAVRAGDAAELPAIDAAAKSADGLLDGPLP